MNAELEKKAWKFANEETVFPISMTGAEIQHSAGQAKNSFIAGYNLATTQQAEKITELDNFITSVKNALETDFPDSFARETLINDIEIVLNKSK